MEFLNIDLQAIKFKLMSQKSGLGWSLELCEKVELQYKRWMTCVQRYPNQRFVPSHYIDLFWHHHILDTEKYAADCHACFGYFVHHYPYFGMQGIEDAKVASAAWNNTKDIFKLEFGVELDELEKANKIINLSECSPGACAGQDCEPTDECSSKINSMNLDEINSVRPKLNLDIH